MFKIKPTRTISCCFTYPVPNTMAFGGVATGNMNAQDAPKPMINAKPNGGAPMLSAIEMNNGTNKAADAVLEVNSVKNTIKNDTNKPMMK